MNSLTIWGTFLSGLGTLIIALVGGAILAYDVRLRRRQLRETRFRSYATLNIDLQVSIYPTLSAGSIEAGWVLESRIVLKNVSSEIWAVPAAYIHARALPEIGNEGPRTFSEGDFYELRPMGQLSEPKNLARFSAAIWHLAPDEVDSVVRWDIVSDEAVRQFAALIVRAEVYSVPNELIGASYLVDNGAGTERSDWIDFMEGENGARHKKVAFTHTSKDVEGIKKGDWALLEAGSAEIDVKASKRFRKILANLCHTGRQNLVVLNGARAKELCDRSHGEPPAAKPKETNQKDAPNTVPPANG